MKKITVFLLITFLVACPFCCFSAIYGEWSSSSLGGGGYISKVVFSKSDPSILYANSDVCGIFKSTDGGNSWTMIHGTAATPLYNVRDIAVDPRNSDIVFAAVGSKWDKRGVFRSEDGGASWEQVNALQFYGMAFTKYCGNVFARDPNNTDRIYVASTNGIYLSTDNGLTWNSLGLSGYFPADLKIDATNSNRIWFSAKISTSSTYSFSEGGIFLSEDGGTSWKHIFTESGPSKITQPSYDTDRIYGIFSSKSIKYSEDYGATWSDAMDGLPYAETTSSSINVARYRELTEGDGCLLTISTKLGYLYKLVEGATSWQEVDMEKPDYPDNNFLSTSSFAMATSSIVLDPSDANHWLLTDWYGIYQTSDAGASWATAFDGLELTVIFTIANNPNDDKQVFVGMADHKLVYSADYGKTLKRYKDTGDLRIRTKMLSFSAADSQYAYANGGTDGGISKYLYASTDGGYSWSSRSMSGMSVTSINSVVASPLDKETVYVANSGEIVEGSGGIYKSTDSGDTFTWDSEGMSDYSYYFTSNQYDVGSAAAELAVDKSGNSMVAISSYSNRPPYYRLSDGTWQKCGYFSDRTGYKNYDVVADPFVNNRFYIASSWGFYRSSDGGATWEKLSTEKCSNIACDPFKEGRIAVFFYEDENSEPAISISEDSGTTFVHQDDNIPNKKEVKLCFTKKYLLAGTHGNGVFYLPLDGASGFDLSLYWPAILSAQKK